MLIARSVHPLAGEAERKERLLGLIDGFSSRRVLVVGDLIADQFIYGEVARVSREAPVLILNYSATEMVAGGAGNAANNVAALGGRARLVGLVGADPEGRRLLASLRAGVDGYLTKERALDDVLDALSKVAAGERYLTDEQVARTRALSGEGTGEALTERELEVLRLLSQGKESQAIADELTISANTVRTHLQNIFSKLGVHSKLEAVTAASSRGLL